MICCIFIYIIFFSFTAEFFILLKISKNLKVSAIKCSIFDVVFDLVGVNLSFINPCDSDDLAIVKICLIRGDSDSGLSLIRSGEGF